MVRAGWNTELGRVKWDCELGEVDLQRFLLENGLSPDAQLTESEAFWILYFSAEIYSDVTKARLYKDAGGQENENRAMAVLSHAQALKAERDTWLEKVRQRLDGQAAPAS